MQQTSQPAAEIPVCSVVIARKVTFSAKESRKGIAVYNSQNLQQLFSVLGLKNRHGKPLTESILNELGSRVSNGSIRGFQQGYSVHRPDGTVSVHIRWEEFMAMILEVARHDAAFNVQPRDLKLADELLQGNRGVIIMVCGTAGTGKSTLASLLGQRLGISTILSTDSIRHALRGFVTEAEDPVLHASTYMSDRAILELHPELANEPAKKLVKLGFKSQSSAVVAHLKHLVEAWHHSGQCAIVEGVHLHLKAVMELMQQFPSILPFLVFIKKETKHAQRMSVRAKYMTADPSKNKYIRNMKNIRLIQDYLLRTAEKFAIPKVANSNLDVSVQSMHRTVLAALHRLDEGLRVVDDAGHATMLLEQFNAVQAHRKVEQARMKAIKEASHAIDDLVANPSISVQQPALPPHRTQTAVLSQTDDIHAYAPSPLDEDSRCSSPTPHDAPQQDNKQNVACDASVCLKVQGKQPALRLQSDSPGHSSSLSMSLASNAKIGNTQNGHDSSSESEAAMHDEDTHDDDSDDHIPVLGSNFSTTEVGSLCDSTEMDDDDALARLWTVLLPHAGSWSAAVEPKRSVRLCQALIAYLSNRQAAPLRLPQFSRLSQSFTLRAVTPTRRGRLASHSAHYSTGQSMEYSVKSSRQSDDTSSVPHVHTLVRKSMPSVVARYTLTPSASNVQLPKSATLLGQQGRSTSCSPGPATEQSFPATEQSFSTTPSPPPAAQASVLLASRPQLTGRFEQISQDLDVLLSDSADGHAQALQHLQALSQEIMLRLPVVDVHSRSRSAHTLPLAAVAEDPSSVHQPGSGGSDARRQAVTYGSASLPRRGRHITPRRRFEFGADMPDPWPGTFKQNASASSSRATGSLSSCIDQLAAATLDSSPVSEAVPEDSDVVNSPAQSLHRDFSPESSTPIEQEDCAQERCTANTAVINTEASKSACRNSAEAPGEESQVLPVLHALLSRVINWSHWPFSRPGRP